MPWTKQDYPNSMKNLPDETREKAIEIGNALLDDGYEEGGPFRLPFHRQKNGQTMTRLKMNISCCQMKTDGC
ncbi:hypothetical protein MGI18_16395 [Bacillus sp. OVS6]|nr:hypothetical protein MGI18_16395 [Bacillus sp. OVS6]